MHDNPHNPHNPHNAHNDNASERSLTATLAGGEDAGYGVAQRQPPKVSRTTLAFAGMALAAAGGLYLMKTRAGPAEAGASIIVADPAAAAARQSIQAFLAGGTGEIEQVRHMLADTDAIRGRFGELGRDRQVPLDALKTNPFWRDGPDLAVDLTSDVAGDDAYARRLRRDAAARVEADARRLEVGTVLLGARPACQINGHFRRMGDVVGDNLVIVGIDRTGVRVARDGFEAVAPLSR